MTGPTYARYKHALEEIAAGADDPAVLAADALRSRKPVAKPKEDVPERPQREYGPDRARRNYREWLAAGKPSMREWATVVGLHPSTAQRWIAWGKRIAEQDKYYASPAFKRQCDSEIARYGWEEWKRYHAGEVYTDVPERKYWRLNRYIEHWGVPKGAPQEQA